MQIKELKRISHALNCFYFAYLILTSVQARLKSELNLFRCEIAVTAGNLFAILIGALMICFIVFSKLQIIYSNKFLLFFAVK